MNTFSIEPSFSKDASLTYLGETFSYSTRALIYQQSVEGDNQFINDNTDIKLPDNIPQQTLSDFIRAIEFEEIEINEDNFIDLLHLSILFKTNAIKSEIENYVANNLNPALIIRELLLYYDLDLQTYKEEEIISDRIVECIELDESIKIPLVIMNRILNMNTKASSDQILELKQRLCDSDVLPTNILAHDEKRYQNEIRKVEARYNDYIKFIEDISSVKEDFSINMMKCFERNIAKAFREENLELVKKLLVYSDKSNSKLVCECLNGAINNKKLEFLKSILSDTGLQEKLVLISFTMLISLF